MADVPMNTAERDLWAEAAATLSDKEKKVLNADNSSNESISSSVLQMAEQKKAESDKKLWSFSFHGQRILVRDVLQHILDWTKKFQQVAEFAVGLDVSGHAAIPWSAIKFFLDVASKSFEKSGAMLLGMEFVTREISFFAIFEVLYLQKTSDATEILSQSLIRTYAKLLGYLARAKEYYSDGTFKRIMKAPFDDGGVDEMMKDVTDNRTLIEGNARLIEKQALDEGFEFMLAAHGELKKELDNWRVPLDSISTKVIEINDATKLAKIRKILSWLSPIQYEMHHQRAKDGFLQNSGRWLLDHEHFNQWKGSLKSSTLLLQGILGSGKTKLSSLVVETITNTNARDLNPVAYFYCIRDSAELDRADPTQILRCIARQFAYDSTTSAIRPAAINIYRELTEGGIGDRQLDLDQSATLIIDLTEGLASATIIIDAMDECEDILTLLGKLEWILQRAKVPVRIFISSRIEKKVSIGLKNLPTSTIEIGENSGDIGLFVRTEVERAISKKSLLSGELSPETKQEIIETLTAGAQGMFRWASLQLESLKKLKNEENVIKELSRLPLTLSETYAKIYSRMSETDTFQIAVQTLKLLACSQKPLKASALLTAVYPLPHKPIDSESLLDYCFNLIVKDKALDIFRFAHLSVREYLETRDDYTPINTHAVAAEICLACITKAKGVAGDRMIAKSLGPAPYAMIEYATMFWPVHCGLSGEKRAIPPLAPPISSFITRRRVGNAFKAWMEDARALVKSLGAREPLAAKLRYSFCSPPNPFFLACVFGLHEVVEGSSVSDTAKCEYGYGGLHLASMYGHEQVVRVLLRKGASVHSKDTYGRTPLHYAIGYGYSKIIEVLLGHDKDIEITSDMLFQAAWGSQYQEENVLEILLRRDGKVQISQEILRIAVPPCFVWRSQEQRLPWNLISHTKFRDKNADFIQEQESTVLIERLFDLPQEIDISQETFELAAATNKLEMLTFIIDQYEPDKFIITTQMLQELTLTPNTEALKWFLPFYKQSQQIPIEVIITAAAFGGLEPLKVLVDYGIKKGYETQITQEAFEAAARNGSSGAIKVVEFLRGLNTNLQITTKVIVTAAGNLNHQEALQLVQYFHTQNPEAEITEAVIKEAIFSGNPDLLNYLLDTFKQFKVTQELVEHAATMLHTTASNMVELLLAMNPEIQVDEALLQKIAPRVSRQAMSALFDRCKDYKPTERMVIEVAKYRDNEIVEFLITRPPGLQITGATIIAFIASRRLQQLCKEILEIFCDNAKDFKPTEDVAIAAARSDLGRQFLGYLIVRYGSVPITDSVWKAASRNRSGDTIKFLLDQNFKPQDTEIVTASVAVRGLVQVVKRLSQAWKEIDSEKWLGVANLCSAISDRDVKKIQELISRGVWYSYKHQELGWTPLHEAACLWNDEIVKILLQAGKVDLKIRDENGMTPLCWAATRGSQEIVKILVEAGADLQTRDEKGRTTLFCASEQGNQETVKILLEAGADVETRDEEDQTPLCGAAKKGYKKVVKILLEAGADLKVVNFKNATPEMLATAGHHQDVCELLKHWKPQVA